MRDAAEQLAFTPNRTARTLRRQSSEVIALVIPDIENPFFTALARGVEDRAQAAGYSVVLCNTDEDTEKEAHYLEIAVSENMAGVILAAGLRQQRPRRPPRARPAVVAVDRGPHGVRHRRVSWSTTARRAGGHRAPLREAGFRRIACITGPARRRDRGRARPMAGATGSRERCHPPTPTSCLCTPTSASTAAATR